MSQPASFLVPLYPNPSHTTEPPTLLVSTAAGRPAAVLTSSVGVVRNL